jgi:hypothetical protein
MVEAILRPNVAPTDVVIFSFDRDRMHVDTL